MVGECSGAGTWKCFEWVRESDGGFWGGILEVRLLRILNLIETVVPQRVSFHIQKMFIQENGCMKDKRHIHPWRK